METGRKSELGRLRNVETKLTFSKIEKNLMIRRKYNRHNGNMQHTHINTQTGSIHRHRTISCRLFATFKAIFSTTSMLLAECCHVVEPMSHLGSSLQ